MNKIFQLYPSGDFLMDYCYVNLSASNSKVELLPGSLIEKLEYIFVKRKFMTVIKKLNKQIYLKNCFDFDLLLGSLLKRKENIWDLILYSTAIKSFAIWKTEKTKLSTEEKYILIVWLFLDFIQENHGNNIQILKLKFELIKTEAEAELIIATISAEQMVEN